MLESLLADGVVPGLLLAGGVALVVRRRRSVRATVLAVPAVLFLLYANGFSLFTRLLRNLVVLRNSQLGPVQDFYNDTSSFARDIGFVLLAVAAVTDRRPRRGH